MSDNEWPMPSNCEVMDLVHDTDQIIRAAEALDVGFPYRFYKLWAW
jgi:hypothetical protein